MGSHVQHAEAMAAHEEIARRQIDQSTWGHLYPEPNRVYCGHIDIAWSGSEYVVMGWDLRNCEGPNLPSSPITWEDFNWYACELTSREIPEGHYRIFCSYCRPGDGNEGFRIIVVQNPQIATFGEPEIFELQNMEQFSYSNCD
jgi:hypothetical protein